MAAARSDAAPPAAVVTITREEGCGAESIAEKLATELGMHLYDWELVEQIAQDAHVSTQLVATLGEKESSELEDWLAEFRPDRALSSQAYLESLKRVLFSIAAHGNAVIVGRGSSFFLPPDKRIGLSFVAPVEQRIKNTMREMRLSEKEARDHISTVDAEHRKAVRKHFLVDIGDSTHYPRDRMRSLLCIFVFVRVTFVPTALLIGVWFLIQLFDLGTVANAQTGGVAYVAHIRGFLFGVVSARFLRDPRRNVVA